MSWLAIRRHDETAAHRAMTDHLADVVGEVGECRTDGTAIDRVALGEVVLDEVVHPGCDDDADLGSPDA
ncbi:hypothetical protein IAE22_31675, partial [Bacillus sp. S34]|nr:hypothetical protein [Bacillus sp. S34]